MKPNILKPTKEPLEINGKMGYAESQRAWGTIRLKSEIFQVFKQLKQRRKKFGYKMLFCREFKELEKQLAKIKKEIGVPPLLVWFVKE